VTADGHSAEGLLLLLMLLWADFVLLLFWLACEYAFCGVVVVVGGGDGGGAAAAVVGAVVDRGVLVLLLLLSLLL